jgi:hypothetical protein
MSLPNLTTTPITSNMRAKAMGGPATRTGVVVLDTDYPEYAKYLYVGVGGDVNLMHWDGTTDIIPEVPGGTTLPIATKRVLDSGTTASNFRWLGGT